ncbi:MAG TPA: DUF1800 domain-containing protein [Acidobacteriota bacterium]|nr:DUF1800 domain-containing protein [Acidobacteriota bacterium]
MMQRFFLLLSLLACGGSALAQRPVLTRPAPPDREFRQWDRQTAAHLMRRAGFSASLQEIDRLVEQGFPATLDELLNYEQVDDSELEDLLLRLRNPDSFFFDPWDFVDSFGDGFRVDVDELRQWQVLRMMLSKRQLLEKMTFFWHDHFATSIETVKDATRVEPKALMALQNQTLRQHALGNFKEMVHAISKDPAMLVWLDNISNKAGKPNENWARELMELFTMGVGEFSEEDVQEAARAFTGWTFDRDSGDFIIEQTRHDAGLKTVLGETGPLNGDDVIEIIFRQPVTAEFITRTVWEHFAYQDPDPHLVRNLARVFRESGYEIKPLMRALFRHPKFFSDRAMRGLVKQPVELIISAFREVGFPVSFLAAILSIDAMNELGQPLFAPPNVGGFPQGRAWLNTASMLSRFNFFADSFARRRAVPLDPFGEDVVYTFPEWLAEIATRNELRREDDYVSHFANVFLQGDLSPDSKLILEDYMRRGSEGQLLGWDLRRSDADAKVLGLVFLIMSLPEYQMN